MPQDRKAIPGSCCGPTIKGLRRLTFPDGTQVGVFGLDAVMESLYRESKPAEAGTAAEMVERLERDNYIAPSARPAYEELFLAQYEQFLAARSGAVQPEKRAASGNGGSDEGRKARKMGFLGALRSGRKPAAGAEGLPSEPTAGRRKSSAEETRR